MLSCSWLLLADFVLSLPIGKPLTYRFMHQPFHFGAATHTSIMCCVACCGCNLGLQVLVRLTEHLDPGTARLEFGAQYFFGTREAYNAMLTQQQHQQHTAQLQASAQQQAPQQGQQQQGQVQQQQAQMGCQLLPLPLVITAPADVRKQFHGVTDAGPAPASGAVLALPQEKLPHSGTAPAAASCSTAPAALASVPGAQASMHRENPSQLPALPLPAVGPLLQAPAQRQTGQQILTQLHADLCGHAQPQMPATSVPHMQPHTQVPAAATGSAAGAAAAGVVFGRPGGLLQALQVRASLCLVCICMAYVCC